eukprot:4276031-Lingulodinium_polyedra.AAC.1
MARNSNTLMCGTAPDARRGQKRAASCRRTRQSAKHPAPAAAARRSAMRGGGASALPSAQSSRAYSPFSSAST